MCLIEPSLILLPAQNLGKEPQNRSRSVQSSAEAQHVSVGGCRSGSVDPRAGGSGQQGLHAGDARAGDAHAGAAEPGWPRAGSSFPSVSWQAGAGQKQALFSPSASGGGAAITLSVISWDDSRIKVSESPVE